MALQTEGTISLSEVATEFGATAPYSLTDFYRGGAHVPSTGTVGMTDATAEVQDIAYTGTRSNVVVTATDSENERLRLSIDDRFTSGTVNRAGAATFSAFNLGNSVTHLVSPENGVTITSGLYAIDVRKRDGTVVTFGLTSTNSIQGKDSGTSVDNSFLGNIITVSANADWVPLTGRGGTEVVGEHEMTIVSITSRVLAFADLNFELWGNELRTGLPLSEQWTFRVYFAGQTSNGQPSFFNNGSFRIEYYPDGTPGLVNSIGTARSTVSAIGQPQLGTGFSFTPDTDSDPAYTDTIVDQYISTGNSNSETVMTEIGTAIATLDPAILYDGLTTTRDAALPERAATLTMGISNGSYGNSFSMEANSGTDVTPVLTRVGGGTGSNQIIRVGLNNDFTYTGDQPTTTWQLDPNAAVGTLPRAGRTFNFQTRHIDGTWDAWSFDTSTGTTPGDYEFEAGSTSRNLIQRFFANYSDRASRRWRLSRDNNVTMAMSVSGNTYTLTFSGGYQMWIPSATPAEDNDDAANSFGIFQVNVIATDAGTVPLESQYILAEDDAGYSAGNSPRYTAGTYTPSSARSRYSMNVGNLEDFTVLDRTFGDPGTFTSNLHALGLSIASEFNNLTYDNTQTPVVEGDFSVIEVVANSNVHAEPTITVEHGNFGQYPEAGNYQRTSISTRQDVTNFPQLTITLPDSFNSGTSVTGGVSTGAGGNPDNAQGFTTNRVDFKDADNNTRAYVLRAGLEIRRDLDGGSSFSHAVLFVIVMNILSGRDLPLQFLDSSGAATGSPGDAGFINFTFVGEQDRITSITWNSASFSMLPANESATTEPDPNGNNFARGHISMRFANNTGSSNFTTVGPLAASSFILNPHVPIVSPATFSFDPDTENNFFEGGDVVRFGALPANATAEQTLNSIASQVTALDTRLTSTVFTPQITWRDIDIDLGTSTPIETMITYDFGVGSSSNNATEMLETVGTPGDVASGTHTTYTVEDLAGGTITSFTGSVPTPTDTDLLVVNGLVRTALDGVTNWTLSETANTFTMTSDILGPITGDFTIDVNNEMQTVNPGNIVYTTTVTDGISSLPITGDINLGIPNSGTLSLTDFYGGRT